jgi:hypothetical protein
MDRIKLKTARTDRTTHHVDSLDQASAIDGIFDQAVGVDQVEHRSNNGEEHT